MSDYLEYELGEDLCVCGAFSHRSSRITSAAWMTGSSVSLLPTRSIDGRRVYIHLEIRYRIRKTTHAAMTPANTSVSLLLFLWMDVINP